MDMDLKERRLHFAEISIKRIVVRVALAGMAKGIWRFRSRISWKRVNNALARPLAKSFSNSERKITNKVGVFPKMQTHEPSKYHIYHLPSSSIYFYFFNYLLIFLSLSPCF